MSTMQDGERRVTGAQIPVKLDMPDSPVDHMVLLSGLMPGRDGVQKALITDSLTGNQYVMDFKEFQQRLLAYAERPSYRGRGGPQSRLPTSSESRKAGLGENRWNPRSVFGVELRGIEPLTS
jgi:hypothetical protein